MGKPKITKKQQSASGSVRTRSMAAAAGTSSVTSAVGSKGRRSTKGSTVARMIESSVSAEAGTSSRGHSGVSSSPFHLQRLHLGQAIPPGADSMLICDTKIGMRDGVFLFCCKMFDAAKPVSLSQHKRQHITACQYKCNCGHENVLRKDFIAHLQRMHGVSNGIEKAIDDFTSDNPREKRKRSTVFTVAKFMDRVDVKASIGYLQQHPENDFPDAQAECAEKLNDGRAATSTSQQTDQPVVSVQEGVPTHSNASSANPDEAQAAVALPESSSPLPSALLVLANAALTQQPLHQPSPSHLPSLVLHCPVPEPDETPVSIAGPLEDASKEVGTQTDWGDMDEQPLASVFDDLCNDGIEIEQFTDTVSPSNNSQHEANSSPVAQNILVLEDLATRVAQLEEENCALRASVETLTKEKAGLDNKVLLMKINADRQRERTTETEEELERAKERLQREVGRLQLKLKSQASLQKAKLQELTRTCHAQVSQISRLQDQLLAKENMIGILNINAKDVNEKCGAIHNTIGAKDLEISKLRGQNDGRVKEINNLNKLLESKENEISKLKHDAAVRREGIQADDYTAQLEKMYHELMEDLTKERKNIEDLQKSFEKFTRRRQLDYCEDEEMDEEDFNREIKKLLTNGWMKTRKYREILHEEYEYYEGDCGFKFISEDGHPELRRFHLSEINLLNAILDSYHKPHDREDIYCRLNKLKSGETRPFVLDGANIGNAYLHYKWGKKHVEQNWQDRMTAFFSGIYAVAGTFVMAKSHRLDPIRFPHMEIVLSTKYMHENYWNPDCNDPRTHIKCEVLDWISELEFTDDVFMHWVQSGYWFNNWHCPLDDLTTIAIAVALDGVIVSNDLFRREKAYLPDYAEYIEKHTFQYDFVSRACVLPKTNISPHNSMIYAFKFLGEKDAFRQDDWIGKWDWNESPADD